MNKKASGVLGFISGMAFYLFLSWWGDYNPQNFFNIVIISLQCFILLKIDKISKIESEEKKSDFIINAIIGAIFAFMIISSK
jgi:hypothetical protein